MPKNLDELDLEILKSLIEDCRKSTTQIAKEAHTTRPTAIARINRLVEEGIVDFGAKINVTKLALKLATIHFEAQKGQSTDDILNALKKCPRIVQLIQLTGKPVFTALMVVEDANTLLSSIERMSSTLNINVVSYQRVLPLIGETFSVKISPEKHDLTPCGNDCRLCLSYQQNECVGCPASNFYKKQK